MPQIKRNSNVNEVNIIKVIEIISIVGEGTEDDPVRQIAEYYNLDGILLARKNSEKDLITVETIHYFGEPDGQ